MLLTEVDGWVEDEWWIWVLMIGVTRKLTGKLVSPRGPYWRRYDYGSNKAGGLDKMGVPRE